MQGQAAILLLLLSAALQVLTSHAALSLPLSTSSSYSSSNSNTRRREQRWDSAVATLENTTEARRRFDHRAHLARVIGIYVGGDESDGESNDILVAMQPDQGGRKLLFLDAYDGRSLGFIELETQSLISQNKILEQQIDADTTDSSHENEMKTSALRGMLVAEDCRGKGYARLFLAIWLRLCSKAGVMPATTRINKPLLALTLVRLGFTPLRGYHLAKISNLNHLKGSVQQEGGGVVVGDTTGNGKRKKRKKLKEKQRPLAVEVSMGTEGRVLLYSPLSTERLQNGFSATEVKSQRLVVSSEPSMPRGRIAHLRVRYAPPQHMMWMSIVEKKSSDESKSSSSNENVAQMVHLPLEEGVASQLRLSASQGPAMAGRPPSTLERAEAMHWLTGRI